MKNSGYLGIKFSNECGAKWFQEKAHYFVEVSLPVSK